MYSTPTLWAVGEALAPAHINTIFHGRRVPTQLEERKLSLEALVNPDLFTSCQVAGLEVWSWSRQIRTQPYSA
jgi:hypothetical protein